jgi:AcrR family transcriptional regulator
MRKVEKPYHHGDLRRALLETALEMLDESDGWQFTLRELARRAGVSHTASYKHFEDKGALLSELALLGFERLRAALLAARPSPPGKMRDEFLEMSRAYLQFGAAQPNLYQLMFSADARVSQNGELEVRAAAALDVLKELIARGQRTGWLRKRAPRAQAAATWAQLHGLVLLTIDGRLGADTVGPNVSDAALAVLLEGLEAGTP